jgi:rod shape-determining protein MreD
MRWLACFILAYLAIGIQIGADPYFRFRGAMPDLILIAVIFIALNARRESALLGCMLIGVMTDLVTGASFGLYTLAYSLVAMFVVSLQEIVYREHPLTHLLLPFFGSLLVAMVVVVYGLIHGERGVQTPMTLFTSALYTAALGPILLGILQRMKRVFAFQPSRRRGRDMD